MTQTLGARFVGNRQKAAAGRRRGPVAAGAHVPQNPRSRSGKSKYLFRTIACFSACGPWHEESRRRFAYRIFSLVTLKPEFTDYRDNTSNNNSPKRQNRTVVLTY